MIPSFSHILIPKFAIFHLLIWVRTETLGKWIRFIVKLCLLWTFRFSKSIFSLHLKKPWRAFAARLSIQESNDQQNFDFATKLVSPSRKTFFNHQVLTIHFKQSLLCILTYKSKSSSVYDIKGCSSYQLLRIFIDDNHFLFFKDQRN